MCEAITQRANDHPVQCAQTNHSGSLCYYHSKMDDGNITPFFEDAYVKTISGRVIYSKGGKKG